MSITKSPLLKAAAIICALVVIGTTPLSAQTPPPAPLPEHTITVDLVPVVSSLVIGSILNVFASVADDEEDVDIGVFSFGIGLQYDWRQREKFGLAGRLNYQGIGVNIKYKSEEGQVHEQTGVNQHNLSFEGHARYYPFGKTLFLDGMAGLGFTVGSVHYEYRDRLNREDDNSIGITLLSGYVALGPSLGVRGTFIKGSPIAYEVSYGYNLTTFLGKPGIKIKESDRDGERTSQYEEVDGWLMFTIPFFPRLVAAVGYSF